MSQVTRRKEIDRRRARRNKIRKLRHRLTRAKNQSEIQIILTKIRKVSPFYPTHQLMEANRTGQSKAA